MRLRPQEMPRYFTHYWSNDTWKRSSDSAAGELLDHTASNSFRNRGVGNGDFIYVVTVLHGALYVAAKMQVAAICTQDEAAAALATSPDNLWDADDHAIGDTATPLGFDCEIPASVCEQLEFISAYGMRHLKFRRSGTVDQQTLRGVRELTETSAIALDAFLPTSESIYLDKRLDGLNALLSDFESGIRLPNLVEGAVRQYTVNAYERNQAARAICVAHWGLTCRVCGFDFERTYGELGRGFIHVHHRFPLAARSQEYVVNPVSDLIPVCPNCHAMLHRLGTPLISPEDLSELVQHTK